MPSEASILATPSATAEVLGRFGVAPKKHFGQNFLVNDAIVGKILALAQVGSDDDILEVGPGIGTLTWALAQRARSVVSLERDADLADVLAYTMREARLFELVMCDALDAGVPELEAALRALREREGACALPSKLVANLPYAVAATVVLRFFQIFPFLGSATVMVQREVAQRMQAEPNTKDYGAYTVKLALYAQAAGSFPVAAGNFLPPPRVESTVIRLDRLAPERTPDQRICDAACTMADAAFFARRKTIANSCTAYFRSRGADAAGMVCELLAQAGIDGSRRGETLTCEEFIALGAALAAASA